MVEWFYPTAFSAWGEKEHAAIDRVLKSSRLTMGDEVAAFESEFALYHGVRHGIMVNSGSSANLIAVATLFELEDREPLKRTHKVLAPALAWPTTYAPLIQHGLELRLSDCDSTWNAHEIEPSENFRLIVGCSILGNPAYLSQWKEYAGQSGAFFIEDNCESLGAITDDGNLCGTYGLMNTFSFFYSHQISAVEGGMILTNDDECANIARMLRNHGWNRGNPDFDLEYDFHYFGYNVRPLEVHAAIGREQLKRLPEFTGERLTNLAYFWALSTDLPITPPRNNGKVNPFGIAFTVPNGDVRTKLAHALRANGIDCRLPTGGSFLRHKYGAPWKYECKTPNADEIHHRGMFIGNAPYAIPDKIERAVEVIRKTL